MHVRVLSCLRPCTTFPSPSFLCHVINPPCHVVVAPPPSHDVIVIGHTSHAPYEQLLVAEGSGAVGVTIWVMAGPGPALSSFTKKKERQNKRFTYGPAFLLPCCFPSVLSSRIPHACCLVPCRSTHNPPCKQWLADEGPVLVMLVLPPGLRGCLLCRYPPSWVSHCPSLPT